MTIQKLTPRTERRGDAVKRRNASIIFCRMAFGQCCGLACMIAQEMSAKRLSHRLHNEEATPEMAVSS
ncbi:hypothetical protein [Bradyrhizobium sp. STM 3843]|uniref:hypothetical protein n=1 Tax=Bradyrhizobium sp. STM 3843 TaxID=551947 RepID=UPI0011124B2A|nr:hypothetical protein [Bradyrhizobium sp. STM 3843]